MSDYRNQNLQGRSFRGQNLINADFSGADLRGVDFRNADLSGAKFIGAKTGITWQRRVWKLALGMAIGGAFAFLSMISLQIVLSFLEGLVKLIQSQPTTASNLVVDCSYVLFTIFSVMIALRRQNWSIVLAWQWFITAGAGVVAVVGAAEVTGVGAVVGAVEIEIAGMGMVAIAGAGAGMVAVVIAGAGAGVGAGMRLRAVMVAGALALAITVAVTVAITVAGAELGAAVVALAGANAKAVVGAVALAVTGTVVLAGAVTASASSASSVAGAFAGVLALAGAVVVGVAIVATGAVAVWIGFGFYLNWRCLKHEEATLSALRRFSLAWQCWGGSDFRGAILTNTDFSRADLRQARFTDTPLIGCSWQNAQNLHLADTRRTLLEPRQVRLLLSEGNTGNGDF